MIAYIIKVSLCWILFYALYQLLYKKITFFSANRAYLLGTLLLGACIPLLEYVTLFSQPYEAVNYVAPILLEVDQFQLMVEEEQSFDYARLFLAAYLLGLVIVAAKFLMGIARIYRLYSTGEKERKKNFTLVRTDKLHLPFSFYNCVFISNKLPLKEKINTILEHELCHINERHTFDVLLVELIKIAFWCSPPIYLYKKELKQVHEYIADNVTLAHEDKKEYGQLLLGQSSSGIELSLTHQFFNSHLKKRIQMMNQKKSSKKALVSYLALVPLLLLLGLSFSSYVGDNTNGDLGREIELSPIGESGMFQITDKITGEELGMISETVAQYLKSDDPEDAPIISIFGEETDRSLREVYPWDEKICLSYTPPAKTMELYGDRGKNGMIAITRNEQRNTKDVYKQIREEIVALFSSRKDFEKNAQNVYNKLRNEFPNELDFIRRMFVRYAIESNQEFLLDDYRIINLEEEYDKGIVRIDTITTFDYDTYEERVEIIKVYEDSDPKKEIKSKIASLFSEKKNFEKNKQKIYDELRTAYPKELDFIRATFLHYANETKQELVLDDFSIVNAVSKDASQSDFRTVVPTRKLVSIDTITTFDFDTYEETVEIVRNYEDIDEESSKILKIDTLSVYDPATQEESIKIVRTFGNESQSSDSEEMQKGQAKSYEYVNSNNISEVFKRVEEMPRFPGCEDNQDREARDACAKQKLLEFIYGNIKYPKAAIENEIEGVTVVQFIVEQNGRLSNINLVREIGGGCGDETLRVVEKMNQMEQRWIPGKQRDNNVRVLYTLPVKYKLADDTPKMVVEETEGPLLILDGEEVSAEDLNAQKIEEISVYKGAKAIEKFGSKGAHGVVEMFSKMKATDKSPEVKDTDQENNSINNLNVFSNLDRMEFETFKVFPNPVNDQLNLSFISKDEGDVEIHLFDETGKQLLNKSIEGNTFNEIFDLSHLKTTKVLFLTISQNNKTHTQKVIRTE